MEFATLGIFMAALMCEDLLFNCYILCLHCFELNLIIFFFKTGLWGAREWNGDKVRDIGAVRLTFLFLLQWVRRPQKNGGDVKLSSFLVLLYRKTSRHCSAEGCILTQDWRKRNVGRCNDDVGNVITWVHFGS